jgi:saccharopine dehydrogenase-like NADP-dependent oxidoreductase
MGRFVVRTLVRSGEVEEIVVADRDRRSAEALAELYPPSVRGAAIDVHDEAALEAVVNRADVVVNTAGPFFRVGSTVLDAVIRRGGIYIDINDDPEPTLAALDRHDEARRTGAACVIGLGGSPGVTNLLATLAAERLDVVHHIVTAWNIAGAGPPDPDDDPVGTTERSSAAALEHFVRQTTRTILQLDGSEIVEVAPLQPLMIDIDGHDPISALTVGHPEAVTLHRRFPGLVSSTNAFFAPPRVLARVVEMLRATSEGPRDRGRAMSFPTGVARASTSPPSVMGPGSESLDSASVGLPLLVAVAVGERSGMAASVTATMDRLPPSGMGGATGVAAAVGALLALRGALPGGAGVSAPEEIIPSAAFFDELARWMPEPAERPYRLSS